MSMLRNTPGSPAKAPSGPGRIVVILLVAAGGLFMLSLVGGSFLTVPEGKRAVVTRFGEFSYVAGPGLHFKIPFVEAATEVPVSIESLRIDRVNTYTIDNQELDANLVIQYRRPVDEIEYIYKNVGQPAERLETLAIDRFKAEMGKVNVTQVAQKRGEVAQKVLGVLQAEAKRLYRLEVIDFQITSIDYTEAFRQANDQSSVAKAAVERAEQEKRQAEVEAETKRIQAAGEANAQIEAARGKAESTRVQAIADAEATRIKGEAEAQAISAQNKALSDGDGRLVELRRAERWNGQLPTNVYGAAPIPFLPLKD